jgi:hypothetical protein
MLNVFFADAGRDFEEQARLDQNAALVEDALEVGQVYGFPEEFEIVKVNTSRFPKYKGHPSQLINRMWLGSSALFTSLKDDNILIPVRKALEILHQLSAPSVKTGGYIGGHFAYVNRRRYNLATVPKELDEDIVVAQVVNRVDFASTMETPEYHRIYQKAFTRLRREYRGKWDIRLEFSVPSAFGGNIYTSTYRPGRFPVYNIPVLTIAELNTLPRAGQFVTFKRRTLRSRPPRMNPIARQRRRRRPG